MGKLEFLEFKSEDDYKKYLSYLFSISKEESIEDKQRHSAIMNTKKQIIGLSMSQLRYIAKQISKSHYENFLKFSTGEIFEDSMVKGLVIAEIKDFDLQIKYLDDWIRTIDSWGLVDSVVTTMKWLKKPTNNEKYFEYFYNLCFLHDEYVSRFGIVTIMAYYISDIYLEKIFKMCERVREDKYYIQMAIAWLLSFVYIKFPKETYNFLEKKVLPKFTQNKAISKCRDSFRVSAEDKEKLKELRI